MAEPSSDADDPQKKTTRYTVAIAPGIATVLVWLIDHKVCEEYKEPLRLTAPFIGLAISKVCMFIAGCIAYYRNERLLKGWLADCQAEYNASTTPARRKKQLLEDIADYQRQIREIRKKYLNLLG